MLIPGAHMPRCWPNAARSISVMASPCPKTGPSATSPVHWKP